MKAVIFVTAALMTSASIYGVVSYKHLSNTKDFENLYVEKKEVLHALPQPVKENKVNAQNSISKIKEEKKPVDGDKKAAKKNASSKKKAVKKEPINNNAAVTKIDEVKTNEVKKPVKKTKRVSSKMFSRAVPGDND